MKKNTSYVGSLICGVNVIMAAMVVVICSLIVYMCDDFNLLTAFLASGTAFITATLIMVGIAAVCIFIATLKSMTAESIAFADNVLVIGIFGLLMGVMYTILADPGYMLVKYIALGLMLLLDVALFIARKTYFRFFYMEDENDKKEKTPVIFAKYYKTLFKKFWFYIVLVAVVMIAVIIMFDKANLFMQIKGDKRLKQMVVFGGITVALIFALLYVARLVVKRINSIDIALINGFVGALAVLGVSFVLTEEAQILAQTIAAIIGGVSLLLSFVLYFTTHVETDARAFNRKNTKISVGKYFKTCYKKMNFFAMLAVSAFIVAMVVLFDATNIIGLLIYNVKINSTITIALALSAIALIFVVLAADASVSKPSVIDTFLLGVVFVGVLAIVAFEYLVKAPFVPKGLLFAVPLALALIFIIYRIFFLKIGSDYGIEAVATPVAQAEEPAEAIDEMPVAEEPTEEVAAAVAEETPEEEPTEEVAEEAVEEPAEEVAEEVVEEVAEEPVAEAVEEVAEEPVPEIVEEKVETLSAVAPAPLAEEPQVIAPAKTSKREPELVRAEYRGFAASVGFERSGKLRKLFAKRSFELNLRTGDDKLKESYSEVKNALLSYGLHSRITRRCDKFTRTGLTPSKERDGKNVCVQAKMLLRGKKTFRLLLNIDPATISITRYHHKDVSEKFPDQPTCLKIRSKRSVKYALELIDTLARQEGFNKKRKFEPIDYKAVFTDARLSYMQKIGYGYLIKSPVSYQDVVNIDDSFVDRIIKQEKAEIPERYIYDEITLSKLEKNFKSGEHITMEAMRVKELVKPNANHITVKASEKLSKRLIVEATEFDPKAAEMIFIADGEAIRFSIDEE